MLRDITIGQHFPGNSLVHRFDPRLKILLTILYIVLLFAAANPLGLALSIAWLAVLYKMAKIPVRMIVKSLKPIVPIILFTCVLNLFFVIVCKLDVAGVAIATSVSQAVSAVLIAHDTQELDLWSDTIMPAVNLTLAFVVPLLVLAVEKLRKQ